jgi:hypothetical protein
MSPLKYAGAAAVAALTLAACGSSSGPSSTGRQVAFQLATKAGTSTPAPGAALLSGSEVIGLGSDTIVITSVQVVLEQIKLERVGGTVCDTVENSHDDCEELSIGPTLLDLPLGAGAARQFTVAIDTGSFEKIQFKVHKPESGHDAAFIAANPAFDGVSIKATGTWNGTPFTYITDLDVEQEAALVPPITVTDTVGANLTLFVNLAGWYANQQGTGLINPTDANVGGQSEGEVKNNIEASFNAFEDDNHDGGDDHGGS